MEIFASILRGVGSLGPTSRTLGGQAYEVDTPNGSMVLTPLAVEPELVVVIVTGPEGAPVEDVVHAVLKA